MHSITKQLSYRNDKTVLVKVYVEKPKKKRSSSIQQYHHHHHYYHIHHTVTQEVNDGSSSSNSSKGYDRKSGLLMYSRLLRNSVRGEASFMPLLPSHSANNTIQPTNQLNSIKKHGGTTCCFGNWKFLVPSFLLRSWSNDPKKEKKKKQGISGNGFKKLQVSKGKGFIVKVFSTCK
ncbi:unnamed protein product [Lathyrus oleraceus]